VEAALFEIAKVIMRLTVLAGGVGAAKLLSGLVQVLPQANLTIISNTGDDFRWMGLYISPDIDTVIYTLAGIVNPATGWGVRDDTFHALERLAQLECATWFQLGDRDLATHLYRTHRLECGDSHTKITLDLCRQNGVSASVLPMTDSHVPTLVHTNEGTLGFQDYFVRRHCSPEVRSLSYQGIDAARPAPGVIDAIRLANAIVLCPSNPYLSIGPILAVPGIRTALRETRARVLAVTPIVAGEALKGPAAVMMRQLGEEASASGVARRYQDFLDIFVVDCRDEHLQEQIESLGMEVRIEQTVMDSMEARIALARRLVEILA
jgi:LPPG:FO 2-phospho-L-lactate transferase